ncbi:MAG TPA: AMIN domain-containing protein [Oculatellaceae cyanobacterium]|jgi:N-acetylmuramoyl-L-alanine amidase
MNLNLHLKAIERKGWRFWYLAMLVKKLSIASLIAVSAVCFSEQLAYSANLTGWRFDPTTNQLEINLDQATLPRYSLLFQPTRIVIDLPNTQLGTVPTQQSYSGAVRAIQILKSQSNLTTIVLELSPQFVLTPEQVELILPPASNGERWVLRPLIAGIRTPSNVIPSTPLSILPPATLTNQQTPLVQVPPLNIFGGSNVNVPPATTSLINLPTPIFPNNQISERSLPYFSDGRGGISTPISTATANPVIEFGQALPSSSGVLQTQPTRQSSAIAPPRNFNQAAISSNRLVYSTPQTNINSVNFSQRANYSTNLPYLLPAGTQLNLLYTGANDLILQVGTLKREVLLLQEEVRDRNGKVIIPVGTPIFGSFQSDRNGSRFIAQSMIIGQRNLPLLAQSGSLNNNQAIPQNAPLPTYTWGDVPTNYFNTSQNTTIKTGQIVPVQLMQNLSYRLN